MPEQTPYIRKLRLLSPVGAEAAEYEWPFVVSNKYNPANEILETIRLVCDEFPDLRIALEKNVLNYFDYSSFENMKIFLDKYNKVINGALQMWKGTSIQTEKRPNTVLLRHIIQMCYNYSVMEPEKLNKFYEPFSPEVYGETSFEFVQQMVDQIGFKENEVFIDLGSGVGQVVMHVAAAVNCTRCIGIEKADIPANYADTMATKFRFWLNWYGRKYSDFEIFRGDFFNEEFAEVIRSATFVFVNNFTFGPSVDHRLKTIFENLQDGARILSSREFCPLNFRISNRNLNDIGSIVKVEEITPIDMSVSWTTKPVSYFLHTIDRRKLEHYFAKQNRIKNLDKKALKSFNKKDWEDNEDESIPSKWTRKAWHNYHKSELKDNERNGYSENGHLKKKTRGRPKKISSLKQDIVESDDIAPLDSEMSETNSSTITSDQTTVCSQEQEVKENVVECVSEVECTSSSTRRPGRPKKSQKISTKKKVRGVNHSNLNFLHEQTLRSIEDMSVVLTVAPGCVEQKLCTKTVNQCPVPKITVTNEELTKSDHLTTPLISPCNDPTSNSIKGKELFKPRNIDELLAHYKSNLIRFNNYMKTSQFKQDILQKIEKAKKLKDELTAKENCLNTEIYEVKFNLLKNLKNFFSIHQIESFSQFLAKISDLTAVNSNLEVESIELDKQLAAAEQEYKTLLQFSAKMKENEMKNGFANAEKAKHSETKLVQKEEPVAKVNYKELKYKKYLTQPKIMNKKLSTDSEHSTDLTEASNAPETNGDANSIKMDASRINSMIYKVLNEPTVDSQPNVPANVSVPNTVIRYTNTAKSPVTKSVGRRSKKVKNEKIKTKNGRELIFSNSAGFPSTQVVSKLNSVSKEPPPPPVNKVEKPAQNQAIKLKINCKESKVKILNGCEDYDYDTNNNKRKNNQSNGGNSSSKKNKNETCNEVLVEPRVPMLKLRASGKHYKTIMVNETNTEPQPSPQQSKSSEKPTSQATASTFEHYEQQPPTFQLNSSKIANVAQHNRPTTMEESRSIANAKASLASSRSSSVDSSSHSSCSSRKSRKRVTKASQQCNNSQTHSGDNQSPDSFYPPQNQFPCANLPASLSTSANFMSNYSKQLNYMSIANKEEPNRNILGENGTCFNSNFLGLNKTYFNNQTPESNGSINCFDKDYFNSQNKSLDALNYSYQMNNCLVDAANNGADLINHQQSYIGPNHTGFDYSSLNNRYSNQTANYMPNSSISANHLESFLKRSQKNNVNSFC